MQRQKIKIALALFFVASLVLVSVAAAASQDPNVKDLRWGGRGHGNGGHANGGIDTVYHTIQVTGADANSVSFNIIGSAVKTKSGNVSTMNMTAPLGVTYYFANDTAVFAKHKGDMNNKTPGGAHRPTMISYNDAKVNVAGASAVIAMKNMSMKRLDDNVTEVQFTGFSVYLPDGTGKSYKLDTPVKIDRSKADKTVKIVGSKQFRADLQDALKGGAKFPANAAPVPLKTIDSKI